MVSLTALGVCVFEVFVFDGIYLFQKQLSRLRRRQPRERGVDLILVRRIGEDCLMMLVLIVGFFVLFL